MADPFILPSGNVQIAFSGGRTSGMMLHHILEANGGLPGRAVVTFQNTGREMPETLDFVQECGERWGVHIVWLEYRPAKPLFEVVSHNSASRNGEPFDALIKRKQALPNRMQRWCTQELKILTARRYCLRQLSWKRWSVGRGIRADEAHRAAPSTDDRMVHWHPMKAAGLAKCDVRRFWESMPFNLRLPYGFSNCDGCFLASEQRHAMLARDYPERAAWWAEKEGATGQMFNHRRSYAQIIDMVERQGDWIFEMEGALCQADDGECVG